MCRPPRSRRALARVLLAATALAACSDGSTAPGASGPSATPTLRFAYEGALSGSFVAEGAPNTGVPQLHQTFAQGRREGGATAGFEVLAVQRRAGNLADVVTVGGLPQGVGTCAVDEARCARTEPRCPGVLVAVEIPTDVNVAQALAGCTLKTGSIRITAWTSARATGEFSGAGVCLTRDGRTRDGFRVANGRFDVALTEVVHL